METMDSRFRGNGASPRLLPGTPTNRKLPFRLPRHFQVPTAGQIASLGKLEKLMFKMEHDVQQAVPPRSRSIEASLHTSFVTSHDARQTLLQDYARTIRTEGKAQHRSSIIDNGAASQGIPNNRMCATSAR